MTAPGKNNSFVRHLRCYKVLLDSEMRKIKLKRSLRNLLISLITIPAFTLYSFNSFAGAAAKPAVPPLPVAVALVTKQDVPVYINALGLVTPINTVTVKTQINGQLLQVFFTEGQMVTANTRLAQIDPRPYQAQLLQYKGQLMRDKALLANARIDLERYKVLLSQDSISEQTLATQASLVDQYEGDVKTDQGLIAGVEVNLRYCDILSPIDGRVGLLQVDPGNYVQTSDTNGIVIVNSISPIYVVFSITEDDLPRVAAKFNQQEKIIVEALDRTQNKLLAKGEVYTLDNQIDSTTGTLKIKGIFTNDTNMLFPNQFVNIRLLINTLNNVLVVPDSAVQYGTNGNFVFVVNQDHSVSIKPVTVIGRTETHVAINGDLVLDELVVTEGVDKLKPGSIVQILQNNNQLAGIKA